MNSAKGLITFRAHEPIQSFLVCGKEGIAEICVMSRLDNFDYYKTGLPVLFYELGRPTLHPPGYNHI